MNYQSVIYRFTHSRQSVRNLRISLGGAATILVLVVSGCQPEEKIHTYLAPKADTPPMMRNAGPAVPVPTRMLGAILRQADKTWFFKLTAPPDEAAGLREEFGTFVASTRFENGEPNWEVPEGWTEQKAAPGSMRYTTFLVSSGGPEVSVIPLGNTADETETTVENINRWRGQLELTALETDDYLQALGSDKDAEVLPEAEGEIVSITTSAGKAILIDFVGKMTTGGGPPFANMARTPTTPRAPSQAEETSRIRTPELQPPEHWKEGELNQFRLAAFVIEQGDEQAEVTLSSVGGDLLLNVNRWRGQVGLPDWSADELSAAKQTLTGQDFTADYVKLIGPKRGILGAVINHSGQQWFVKLTGSAELAQGEMEHFENFVKTIRFRD